MSDWSTFMSNGIVRVNVKFGQPEVPRFKIECEKIGERPRPKELDERSPEFLVPGPSTAELSKEFNIRWKRGEVCQCQKCYERNVNFKLSMEAQADFDSCPERDGQSRRSLAEWLWMKSGRFSEIDLFEE